MSKQEFTGGAIFINLVFTVLFGYYALGFDEDADSCQFARNKSYSEFRVPILESKKDKYIQVHERFNLFFEGGFYIFLVQTILYTIGFFVENRRVLRRFVRILRGCQIAMLVLWLFAFICRFTPSGSYCSGDDAPDNQRHRYLYS